MFTLSTIWAQRASSSQSSPRSSTTESTIPSGEFYTRLMVPIKGQAREKLVGKKPI
jgi:hypothetical protein